MRRSYAPSRARELIAADLTQSSVISTSAVACALMRRPSGERQMKSVTNAISRPFHANSHGHDPLSRWLAGTAASAARLELRLQDAVRPGDAGDVGRGRLAEAEVHGRCRDDLLLHVQAGAHFDLAADAERVDALIAGRGRGARANEPASDTPWCRSSHDARAFAPRTRRARAGRRRRGRRRGDGAERWRRGSARKAWPADAEQQPRGATARSGRDQIERRRCCRGRRPAAARVSRVRPGGGSMRTTFGGGERRADRPATTAARRSRRRRARARPRARRPRRPRRAIASAGGTPAGSACSLNPPRRFSKHAERPCRPAGRRRERPRHRRPPRRSRAAAR